MDEERKARLKKMVATAQLMLALIKVWSMCSGVARGEQKGHLPPHFGGIVDKTY